MKGDDGDGDKDVGNDGEEEADEGANAAENAEDSNTSFKPSPLFQGRTPIAVVTGEEDETCTLQLRAKLYRLMSRSEREKDARAKEASKRDSEKGDGISDAEVGLEATSSSSSTASKSGDNTSGGNAEQKVEWVEVGVGPLRVLRANQSSGHSAHNTRLVMRRESDKGGKGECHTVEHWVSCWKNWSNFLISGTCGRHEVDSQCVVEKANIGCSQNRR